jgi:hypothetical protein
MYICIKYIIRRRDESGGMRRGEVWGIKQKSRYLIG